jgi:cation:H+ antiporter
MLENSLILLVSLAALVIASDKLVDGVVQLARRLGVSTMVVGLTVVAVGTSLPELMASSVASYRGYPGLALGNVLGSNSCNIGLILGLPALFAPIVCRKVVVLQEGMLMLGAAVLLGVLAGVFLEVPRWAGVVLLVLFIAFIARVFYQARKESRTRKRILSESGAEEKFESGEAVWIVLFRLVVSFAVIVFSSEYLVASAVGLARVLSVAESVIAVSVVAFGTSVPELSVSLLAARKKQGDILVGNIIGSNISNIFLVLGLAAVIAPVPIYPWALVLDIPFMTIFSLLAVCFLLRPEGINRSRGIVLLLLYVLVILRCVLIPT